MKTIKNIKNLKDVGRREMMRIGISSDFMWFELKRKLIAALNAVGYELTDIGDYELVAGEEYPDFIVPLSNLLSNENDKVSSSPGINSIEACAEVNKIPGVCAAIITEPLVTSKEDDLYVRCFGGQIKGYALSGKKRMTFLNADYSNTIPSNMYLAKVRVLGRGINRPEMKTHLV